MLRTLRAEFLKLKRSRMPLWTALVVVVAPLITVSGVTLSEGGAAATRWTDFMRAAPQLIACWYGTILFGLVTAYVLGREQAEGTESQVLTLPVRRESVLAAKAVVVGLWVLALAAFAVVVQSAYAMLIGVPGASWAQAMACLLLTLKVAILICATLPWVALLTLAARDYVAPMVLSALAAFVGLGFAEAGWGRWFPWSMPISVTGMTLLPAVPLPTLVGWSWALMALVFVTGSAAALAYIARADASR